MRKPFCLVSVDLTEACACSRYTLTTVEGEGCGLLAARLARTHEGVLLNGQQSEPTLSEMLELDETRRVIQSS